LFAEQDRSLWDAQRIAEGTALVECALKAGGSGPYVLQAAIAALYAESIDNGSIDWTQIVALHDVLSRLDPSPVAGLARGHGIQRFRSLTPSAITRAIRGRIDVHNERSARSRENLHCRFARFGLRRWTDRQCDRAILLLPRGNPPTARAVFLPGVRRMPGNGIT